MTKDDFDKVFRIRSEAIVLAANLRDLEAEYERKRRAVMNEISQLQKRCPHPYVKRACAEANPYCEVCGAEC